MAWETWVQSQVELYQRLKKWYSMPPCLTLCILRCRWRVKWSNPGKGVVPSPKPWCSSYWKRSIRVTLDNSHQLYLLYLFWCFHLFFWAPTSFDVPTFLILLPILALLPFFNTTTFFDATSFFSASTFFDAPAFFGASTFFWCSYLFLLIQPFFFFKDFEC